MAAGQPTAREGPAAINIKRLLQLRLRLMLVVAVVVAVPAVLVAWQLSPGSYTAKATLRFLASTPRVMETRGTARETPYRQFLRTQVGLITGNPVLAKVTERPEIRDLPELAGAPDPLGILKGCVQADTDTFSELVTVSCTMPEKDAAIVILQEVIEEYLEYALTEEANAGGERLSILQQERDARQTELGLQLERIQELQSSVSVHTSDGAIMESAEADLYRENLVREELSASRAENRTAEIEGEIAQVKTLQEQAPDKPVYAFQVEERTGTDPRISAVRQNLVLAQAEFAVLAARLAPQAPKYKVEKERVDSLRDGVARVEREVRREVLASTLADLEQQLAVAQKEAQEAAGHVENFEQLLAEYDQHMQDATKELAQVERLKAKADETANLLRDVDRQITELSLESNAPARVRLVAPPTAPLGGPDYGRRKKLLFLALVGSLGLGVAAGIVREQTDRAVRSAQDISFVTEIPVVATIPNVAEDRMVDTPTLHALTVDCPNSTTADEFRRILARILYPRDSSIRMNTILVTSPAQGDGKTFVACNLANALAQANRRVLLVDLSVRHPNIEKRFKLEPAAGLAEVLLEGRSPGSLVRTNTKENLWILGPGLRPEELLGKLGSGEIVTFLEKAEQEFDHVVIDSPSLLLSSDAELLAPLVDGVIVVAGVGKSNAGMIKRCLDALKQVRANVVGVTLNGVRSTMGGYLHTNLKLNYDAYVPRSDNGEFGRELLEMKPADDKAVDKKAPVLPPEAEAAGQDREAGAS